MDQAVAGRAAVGIGHTSLKVNIHGPGAEAETGVSCEYPGGNLNSSFAEAKAGRFAATGFSWDYAGRSTGPCKYTEQVEAMNIHKYAGRIIGGPSICGLLSPSGILATLGGAGPFAARAGVKYGGGIRDGVPEVDVGPITTPCSIM